MGVVEIRSHQIWVAHIHGDDALRRRILGLPPGALIKIEVGGYDCLWKKMENGPEGAHTKGLKPIGWGRRYWRLLYSKRREDIVSIRLTQPRPNPEAAPMAPARDAAS